MSGFIEGTPIKNGGHSDEQTAAEITQPDSNAALRRAEAFLRGERRALQLQVVLKTTLGDGDELLRVIERCPADELPGLARTLQRALEGRPR